MLTEFVPRDQRGPSIKIRMTPRGLRKLSKFAREEYERQGWTQQDVSFYARVSQPTVSRFLRGDYARGPELGTAVRILGALGYDLVTQQSGVEN